MRAGVYLSKLYNKEKRQSSKIVEKAVKIEKNFLTRRGVGDDAGGASPHWGGEAFSRRRGITEMLGRSGGHPHPSFAAQMPPSPLKGEGFYRRHICGNYPAIRSLLSIREKIPGMDSRSTGWEARMGMVSRSSSPT